MKRVIAFAVLLVVLAAPAWADTKACEDAYERKDYEAALKECRPLAEQGDAAAQYNLGVMYYGGYGVPQDYAEAVRWYRKAAEQGNAPAQYNLGVMYHTGQGVPQDYVYAHMWYNVAVASLPASGGAREMAAKNRDIVAKRMTPAQIAEAQRLARGWRPRRQ